MRAIEISLFLIFLIAAIPLIGVLVPAYGDLPKGNASTTFVDKMNMTELNAQKPAEGAGVVEDAVYIGKMAIFALQQIVSYVFMIPESFMLLGILFGIHPLLLGFLGVGLFCVTMFALWQMWKSDSFEGKR